MYRSTGIWMTWPNNQLIWKISNPFNVGLKSTSHMLLILNRDSSKRLLDRDTTRKIERRKENRSLRLSETREWEELTWPESTTTVIYKLLLRSLPWCWTLRLERLSAKFQVWMMENLCLTLEVWCTRIALSWTSSRNIKPIREITETLLVVTEAPWCLWATLA